MDKRTAAPDEAAPPPPPKKAKVTSPFPLMVDVAEVEVERSFVDANIRHALASPEPHLKRDADFFRDALADFKYHSAKILDVDGDPDTDDWDRAAPSDTELDNKDKDKVAQSPPPSVDSVNSSTARILKKLGKKMPEPLPGREGREPPLFTDGLHSTHPPKTSNRVFCDLTSSDKDAVILSACWLAKLGLDWGWPDGYRLVSQQTFPTGGSRWDAYLFGHPSGKKYRSPNEFVPHLKWMAVADLERACLCKCCDGRLLKDPSTLRYIKYGPEEEVDDDEEEEDDEDDAEGVKEEDKVLGEFDASRQRLQEDDNVLVKTIEPTRSLEQQNYAASGDFLDPAASALFPDIGSFGNSLTSQNEFELPQTTINPADLFSAPVPPQAGPSVTPQVQSVTLDNWNGSDYNSESDGDYQESSGENSVDVLPSDSEDSEDLNDDDEDDSGNEAPPSVVPPPVRKTLESEGDETQEEDEMERESLFPDLDGYNRSFKSSKPDPNLLLLDHNELTAAYHPCRRGEVVWYPSTHLNFYPPPPPNSTQFTQKTPFWPCLILATPATNSQTVSLIPLPLPTASELSLALSPVSLHQQYPHLVPRGTIRSGETPSHYTPHPPNAPIFGPRLLPIKHIVPWRLMDSAPPYLSRKYVATDSHWQRRWNRGVIQAVGVSSSWEPIPHPPTSQVSAIPGASWRETESIRWGIEIVNVGDFVHLVLPCPFVQRGDSERVSGSSSGMSGSKHRLMKVDRIVYRSGTGETVKTEEEGRVLAVVEGRRRVGKVVVEGAVYAHRRGVGWVWVGRKRCTMKRVLIGRRFGMEEGVGDPGENKEMDEVGDGYGQVGLIAGESRNVWEGWCSLEDPGRVSSFVEIVRGLEGIAGEESDPLLAGYVNDPLLAGYDFNYVESSSDDEAVLAVGGRRLPQPVGLSEELEDDEDLDDA